MPLKNLISMNAMFFKNYSKEGDSIDLMNQTL